MTPIDQRVLGSRLDGAPHTMSATPATDALLREELGADNVFVSPPTLLKPADARKSNSADNLAKYGVSRNH